MDGAVGRANVAASSWGDMRDGDGTYVEDSAVTNRLFDFDSSFTTDKWSKILRGIQLLGYPLDYHSTICGATFCSKNTIYCECGSQRDNPIQLFDTSAISDTDTIDLATLSFYGQTKVDQGSYAADVNVYSSIPASNTVLVVGDYANTGSTAFSTAITYTNWSTTGYNDFALNASGLAALSKTGVSKFSTRNANYDVANVAPTWRVDAGTHIIAYSADQAGTTQDPKLVVVHSALTPTPTPTPSPTPIQTDTAAPTGSISINSGASYTNSTTVTVTLSATDTVGVTGYYLSTNSSTPIALASGWNSVTSTTSYSGSASYPLTSGDENKTVYAWFKDAVGNVSSTASDSIILDTTAPIVTITSPTSGDTYTGPAVR